MMDAFWTTVIGYAMVKAPVFNMLIGGFIWGWSGFFVGLVLTILVLGSEN